MNNDLYLQSALEQNTLPHALLFSGPNTTLKTQYVHKLSKYLLEDSHRIENETHPDLHHLRPENWHSIESIRALIDEVHSAPFEAKAKIFVIHDADRMQPASANALLKTLEEPTPDTTLVLLTTKRDELLPTIRSRCMELRFSGTTTPLPESQKQLLFSLFTAPHYAAFSEQMAKLEVALEDADKLHIETLFETLLAWFRDQTLRSIHGPTQLLLEPNAPLLPNPLPLSQAIDILEEARVGSHRNIKLSVCLEQIFNCLCTKPNF